MNGTGEPGGPQRKPARPIELAVVGSFAPTVPFLTPNDSCDRGAAGSLLAARARERAERTGRRSPVHRDWRAAVALASAITTAPIAVLAAVSSSAALGLLALCCAAAAAWAVGARYRPGVVERELTVSIRRERTVARELDHLTGAGWSLAHDRLAPGTEHRLAHVLTGPAGVVLAVALPASVIPRLRGGVLHAGARPLHEWFAARWWEIETVHVALGEQLRDWPWDGPVYPLVLHVPDQRPAARAARAGAALAKAVVAAGGPRRRPRGPAPAAVLPLGYAGITIRPLADARAWITALPAPLGRLAAAQLAAAVEDICPPAAVRDQPREDAEHG